MKENKNVDTTITTLEMCAGYGGIGLGIKNIFGERLRTIAYCELEGFAQANLISKMEKGLLDAAPIWNDLKTFPYRSFHGLVDILIAGYPCQPFSSAGKRAGKEDPRHLWPWIADGIRLLQPTMCFFENVEGHISLGLSTVISDLEELGYKVSWGIFSASEVGAPHQRKRVFILAHRNDAGLERYAGNGDAIYQPGRIGQESDGHAGTSGLPAWPSRPGESQYEWEPPRVTKGMAHAHGSRGEEPEHQQANLPSEPSRGNSEAMGNSAGKRPAALGAEHERQCGELCTASTGGEVAMVNSANEGQQIGRPITEGRPSTEQEPQRPNGGREREAESALGGNPNGAACGVDYAELCVSCDNRTDELRLLGNGVVPATAERAFRVLMEELNK